LQLDTNSKTKYWLKSEALINNPKISASIGSGPNGQTTYIFKPPFNMINKKMLLKVLKQHDLKGNFYLGQSFEVFCHSSIGSSFFL